MPEFAFSWAGSAASSLNTIALPELRSYRDRHSQGEIPNSQEFIFRLTTTQLARKEEEIIDLHPLPGEVGIYLLNPETDPLTTDYAVVHLMRGLDRSRWILVLAGTTMIGTRRPLATSVTTVRWPTYCPAAYPDGCRFAL
jgi:hypothetical protein